MIHALAEAWNRKDPDAFAALFTDDGAWTDVFTDHVQLKAEKPSEICMFSLYHGWRWVCGGCEGRRVEG